MKGKVQLLGRFFSGMVMPGMGMFIAWGLIRVLFFPDGWWPNESLAGLAVVISQVILPVFVAYTGGMTVGGQRGGIAGAIAAVGLTGSEIPMIWGAMVIGPLSGWIIRKFDKAVEGRIKAGFEMLVNNFSLGITGLVLAAAALKGVVPAAEMLVKIVESGITCLINHNLLWLASPLVELEKVLLLNNAFNHGLFTPLGVAQAAESGKSLIFLLDTNPGPGLGVLLAYCAAGKGSARLSAPGAALIHFLGGIHETYFPYVLMNPLLLLGMIAGNASALIVFSLTDTGLAAPASPGSILAVLAMMPKGEHLAVLSHNS